MLSGGQNSSLHLHKIASGKDEKCFTQLLDVVALRKPWQMCPVSYTFAAGAAAEQRDHKLLLPHEAAVVRHCYIASTLLNSPGAEESDSPP